MDHRLTRRQVVQGMGGVGLTLLAGCGRLPWQAQPVSLPTSKVHQVGVLSPEGSDASIGWRRLEPFREALRELGHLEGQNLHVEFRFAEGDAERLPALAADLVRLQVEAILAVGPLAAPAAKGATDRIPVVFAYVGDPVGTGLVASLSRPGGNVTGLSNLNEGLSAKRLQLLAEALPGISRVAVVWNPQVASNAADIREMRAAAETLKLQLISLEIQDLGDFDYAIQAVRHEHVEAVIWLGDAVTARGITEFLGRSRLPAMFRFRDNRLDDSALMVYAPNQDAMMGRAAYYVDRILRGTKPADLPVEQPREFDLAINLRTAQALGLTIPPHVLLQATEIIQ